MFNVFIAEDEAASMNYIKNIIAQKCPEFTVAGEAYDGADALEKLETQTVDVLISDIRMSNVDGITLVTKAKDLYPHMRSVIVSGYSEFEYAQGAIRASVADYIMKPIDVAQFVNTMEAIAVTLRQKHLEAQILIWQKLITENILDKEKADFYIQGKSFALALIRKGGYYSAVGEMQVKEIMYTEPGAEKWIVSGRDLREMLVIRKAIMIEEVEKLAERFSEGQYSTITYYEKPVNIHSIYDSVRILAETMDSNVTIGITQKIKAGTAGAKVLEYGSFLRSAEFHLRNGSVSGLKSELIKHFAKWENEKYGIFQIERVLHQLFTKVLSHSDYSSYDYAKPLSYALRNVNSMEELLTEIWNIITIILDWQSSNRQDSEGVFDAILEYIAKNYMEPLSLQTICNRFCMSQPYLSKLFRKYKNTTFNDYLIMLRIEQAKKIMIENQNIKMKDVAQMVGYSDALYFSKVFRKQTGYAPSRYGKG